MAAINRSPFDSAQGDIPFDSAQGDIPFDSAQGDFQFSRQQQQPNLLIKSIDSFGPQEPDG
jgi:hypothetical protein